LVVVALSFIHWYSRVLLFLLKLLFLQGAIGVWPCFSRGLVVVAIGLNHWCSRCLASVSVDFYFLHGSVGVR